VGISNYLLSIVYIEIKYTITTLLLYYRFGQGLYAFITRILSELIGIIIDKLIRIPRAIEFQ